MKHLNVDKLTSAFYADQLELEQLTENAEEEIRQALQPYAESGIFTDEDVKPLAEKLILAKRQNFDKKWSALAEFTEDDDNEEKACLFSPFVSAEELASAQTEEPDATATATEYVDTH